MRQIVDELDRVQIFLKEEVEHTDRLTGLVHRERSEYYMVRCEQASSRVEEELVAARRDRTEGTILGSEKREYNENGTITKIDHALSLTV